MRQAAVTCLLDVGGAQCGAILPVCLQAQIFPKFESKVGPLHLRQQRIALKRFLSHLFDRNRHLMGQL